MPPQPAPAYGPGRVVLLCGPSGAGKSRLAGRLADSYGWTVVRLDDFYRDAHDPALPRNEELGIPDWDHSDSWNSAAAVGALAELITTGRALTPVYDISSSMAVGSSETICGPTDLVIAEGLFAAELVTPLRELGLLHSAWCVRHHRAVTAVLRLVRDLREHRKPPLVLARRGWELLHREPRIIARAQRLGAVPASARQVEDALVHSAAPTRKPSATT